MREWRRVQRDYRLAEQKTMRARTRARRFGLPTAGSFTAGDLLAQFATQEEKCWWCGSEINDGYVVDHVVPLSRGGSNRKENVVASCESCNRSKGAKMPEDFVATLY
jgi:5-methylcytosine-specific restriction endonuclease McrA